MNESNRHENLTGNPIQPTEELEIFRTIFRNVPYYMFLINTDVEVMFTNYYDLNPLMPVSTPTILGNVLRCKNGCDAGCCGMHELCQSCIIRSSIVRTLQTSMNFSDVEAHMKLYNLKGEAIDTDVSISGSLVQVGQKQYVLICVRDITTYKAIQRRFIEKEYQLNQYKREREIYLNFMRDSSKEISAHMGAVERVTSEEKKKDSRINPELTPIMQSLPSVIVITNNDERFQSTADFLSKTYRVTRTHNLEESLTVFINCHADAIIIGRDIDMNEANMLTDAIQCCGENVPTLRILNKGDHIGGTFNAVLYAPFTQKQLLETLQTLNV